MSKSRTYNSVVNSIYGIIASGVTVLLNFAVRVILVRELGDEVNGIHNLFQSIANVMILMEMGIGSAMIIHLYEPVSHYNVNLIKGIMAFYRKVYRFIAIVFFIVSFLLTFTLLDNIVSTTLSIKEIRVFFLLFSLSYVVDYLTYYKRSLLYAEQKNRVGSLVSAACEVIFRSVQILLLLVLQQYELFLILLIIEKLVANLWCNHYVNKDFPFLKKNKEELPKEKKIAIFDTVKPLMVNQIAGTTQQASKGILISILLGNVSIVGYFGNYQLIISVAQMVYSQFGGSFTTSFGNLAVERNADSMKQAYLRTSYILNWIACVCCALFLACVDDFIGIVFGTHFIIDHLSVFVLTLDMMIYLLNIPIVSIQNAMGLHKMDANIMIIQAITAITLAYILGRMLGMYGIFLGLLIPMFIFTFIYKGIIIASYALKMTATSYLSYVLGELAKIIVTLGIIYFVYRYIPLHNSLISIVVKAMIAIVISIVTPCIMSYRSPIFNDSISVIMRIIQRKV